VPKWNHREDDIWFWNPFKKVAGFRIIAASLGLLFPHLTGTLIWRWESCRHPHRKIPCWSWKIEQKLSKMGVSTILEGSVTWGHVTWGPFPGATARDWACWRLFSLDRSQEAHQVVLFRLAPDSIFSRCAEETLRAPSCHLGWIPFLLWKAQEDKIIGRVCPPTSGRDVTVSLE